MSTPTFSMQVKGLFQPNTPKTTASPDLKLLTIWNGVTALVHAGIACFFIYTAISENDNVARDAPLVRIASCWDVQEDHSTPPMPIFDIRNEFVDTGGSRKSTIVACIITFHLLSAAFQGIPWFLYFQRNPFFVRYFNSVIGKNGAQVIRYTEYTVSAPLMVVAIGLSYGILDVYPAWIGCTYSSMHAVRSGSRCHACSGKRHNGRNQGRTETVHVLFPYGELGHDHYSLGCHNPCL
jgi:hypothetical protein